MKKNYKDYSSSDIHKMAKLITKELLTGFEKYEDKKVVIQS